VTAKREAATDLTTAAQNGALSIHRSRWTASPRHDRVDVGARERVLLSIP
jgi:hypothetical protein